MSAGETLRLSRTGVTNAPGQNVCWVAPAVHLFLQDPIFSEYVVTQKLITRLADVKKQLLELVDQFVKQKAAVDVEALLDALAFDVSSDLNRFGNDGERKDVQEQRVWGEAVYYLLQALMEGPDSKRDEEVLMSIFGSSVEDFHTCGSPTCSKIRRLGPPQLAWVLDLPIQGNTTLDAALENIFFGTEVDHGCISCKQVPVLECARLCRLPATLVIDIKRAVKWDGKVAVKSDASLQYPMELPMAKFCTKGALEDGWDSVYRLGGVVLHHGSDGSGGHFTFYQRQASGTWTLFNDHETLVSESPNAVPEFRQLVCGLVYHRTPTKRKDTKELLEQLPGLWEFENLVEGNLPECETPLTTLPARGTAKHRLTPLQLADLATRQAEVVAQRDAADQLKAAQAARQAESEDKVRRRREQEKHARAEGQVVDAMERMRVVEARKLQKAAQEQAALQQQKKAARAAQDAARAKEAQSQVSKTAALDAAPQVAAAPAPAMTKKARIQAQLAAKRLELSERKAKQAAAAAAAQQLSESQAATQKAAMEAASAHAATQQQLLTGSSSYIEAAELEAAKKAQQERAAEAAAQAATRPADIAEAAQQQLKPAAAAEQKEAAEYAEAVQQQLLADAAAAAQKAAAESAAAAQRKVLADAAAAAAQEKAAKKSAAAAQRKLLADAAAAAKKAEAAQQKLLADAAAAAEKAAAESAAAAQQMFLEDAAAVTAAAADAAAAEKAKTAKSEAAAAGQVAAEASGVAQGQMQGDVAAAAEEEKVAQLKSEAAAEAGKAAQQKSEADSAAAAEASEAAQAQVQADVAAAAEVEKIAQVNFEAAPEGGEASQGEVQAHTAAAAAAAEEEAAESNEAAQQKAAESAKFFAELEASATARMQTQLKAAAAAARSLKPELLRTTRQSSAGKPSTFTPPKPQPSSLSVHSRGSQGKHAEHKADSGKPRTPGKGRWRRWGEKILVGGAALGAGILLAGAVRKSNRA